MCIHYRKFDEADRRTVRAWQIAVLSLYTGVFLCFAAAILLNNAVKSWGAPAARAEIAKTELQVEAKRIFANVRN